MRLMMGPLAFLEGLREQHGDVFTIQFARDNEAVVVGDPELVKQVCTAPPDVLHAGEANKILHSRLGRNAMILLDGERHVARRKMLLPRFRREHAEHHERAMREMVEAELDRWPSGGEQASWPFMQSVALNVIMRVVFGKEAEPRLASLREEILRLHSSPEPHEDGGDGDRALGRANELIEAEVRRRQADPDAGLRDDVLAVLLDATYEDGSRLSDTELRDELLLLIEAGHETVAMALTWTLERLARTPDALARAVAEAHEGGGPYTEAVVYEALRIRPAVPAFARLVKQPFQLGEFLLAPGTTIAPSALLVHHRPDIYPDPRVFRPERFLDRPPETYAWIPFGGGMRRCIGATFALFEMRVVLSTLLANASIQAPDPAGEAMRYRAFMLVPSRGGRIALAARRS